MFYGSGFPAPPAHTAYRELMEGRGLIIYRATSLDEAKAIADADPMHANGARSYSVRKWLVNEGSLSISTTLSGQSVTLR